MSTPSSIQKKRPAAPKPSAPPAPAHTVPVLLKAIQVFEAVAQSPGEATAKRLAAALGISPTTCYRILQSFVARGWLRSRAGGAFELSFGLVPLLRPLLHHELLIETVREALDRLARKTGLTAKLTVRQGGDAVTLCSAASPRPHGITSRVGATISLTIGSSGAVFLAELADEEIERVLAAAPPEVWRFQKREAVLRRVAEVRQTGCCFDAGSYQPHVRALSAPLRGRGGEVVGAITVVGFPQDFEGTLRAAIGRELKFAAGGCSQLIQGAAATEFAA